MADINALIAQGVNPVQIESPINQMGKIMSIRNAQQEYSMNEQKLAEQNALRDFLKGNPDLTDANTLGRLTTGFGASGLAYGTKLQELAKAKGEEKAKAFDLADKKTKYFRSALDIVNTPEDAQMWTAALFSDPDVGPFINKMGVPLETVLSHIPKTLGADFDTWKKQASMGAGTFAEKNAPKTIAQDTGGGERVLSIPGLGGKATVVEGSTVNKTPTPGENARLKLEQDKFAWEKAHPGYTIKDTDTGFVAINNKDPNDVKPVKLGAGGPPVQSSKGLTESQAKATGFAARAKEADDIKIGRAHV